MSIPSVPIQNIVINHEEGPHTSPQWQIFFSILITQLQNTLSVDGIEFPKRTSAQITELNTPKSIGRVVFNTTTSEFMCNKTGTFVNFLTS